MAAYILRRILLIVPTLLGIMIINFAIIQSAPGGPVEQAIARMEGQAVSATARLSGGAGGGGEVSTSQSSSQGSGSSGSGTGGLYRGSQGLPDELVEKIQVKYGFDKPWYERFYIMMGNYLTFDFGDSFFIGRPVVDVVIEKMPVSISLGLWSLLITYMISIPLGVAKAVRDGSRFDIWSSATVIVGNALPAFLFAVLLIVLFAGGRYFDWFPLRGLVSDDWGDMSWPDRIIDYFWHLALPLTALVIGSFASLTMLTKNSFLDEINKQYVMTARAKGLSEKQVLFGHVFRNAMLIVIAGFPAALVSILFTGALLVEVIFSLDGLGLLGFEAAINRDYPIVFGTLYFLTLLGLFMALLRDIVYAFVDPRIDFEKRGA